MKEEITAGMDLLDEVRPGWTNQVNLEKLDQGLDEWSNDDCGCVLVHVFGDFQGGLDELYMEGDDATEYGFMLENNWSPDENTKSLYELAVGYWTLTTMWKSMIRDRYGSLQYVPRWEADHGSNNA